MNANTQTHTQDAELQEISIQFSTVIERLFVWGSKNYMSHERFLLTAAVVAESYRVGRKDLI